eukprot:6426141-Amphidinium_carterae.2
MQLQDTDVVPSMRSRIRASRPSQEVRVRAECVPILVIKSHAVFWIHSHARSAKKGMSPSLGSTEIDRDGFQKLVLKSDGEPYIVELKKEVVRRVRELTKVEIILEESEVAESQTPGVIAQAVRAVEEKVWTLKFATEELHGTPITEDHLMLTWCVELAGQIMSRSHRYSSDGQTAFQS